MTTQAYVFAHQALPSEAFSDPTRFLSIVNGPDAQRYMSDLWERAAEYGTPTEGEVPQVEIRGTGNGLIALFFMPPPRETTEAHIVGAFAKFSDPDLPSLDKLEWFRLFTLEHSIDLQTDQPMTMLCEWNKEGTHLNHGGGPEAEERPFVEAVFAILQSEKPPN